MKEYIKSLKNLTSSKPTGKSKSVIPVRCELCSIGIGESTLYEKGTWRKFNHQFKEPRQITIFGETISVDEWCYENLLLEGTRGVKIRQRKFNL